MFFENSLSFTLENFEGPLELLFYLIQKEEVDVCDIAVKELTQQFENLLGTTKEIDVNADILGLAASLLLMKSQKLLPKEEQSKEECEEDPRLQMIQQLMEYCRFREAAHTLSTRERSQQIFFPRGQIETAQKLSPGLQEVGLDDLKTLLHDLMTRIPVDSKGLIQDDPWHIEEKISWFQKEIQLQQQIPFFEVFDKQKSRGELTVFFLALLELMKLQVLKVVIEKGLLYITTYAARL